MILVYYLRQFDWFLVGIACLLVLVGIATIFSLSLGDSSYRMFLMRQFAFFLLGLGAMISFGLFDYRIVKRNSVFIIIFYVLLIFFLIGLFFIAPEIKGARRWYVVGSFTFDPFELLKIAMLLLLAKYFSLRHIEMYRIGHIVRSGLYVAIPSSLVFFQPDAGSVLLLVGMWVLFMILAGIRVKHFFIIAIAGLFIFVLLWQSVLKDYQKERVLNFLDPMRDPQGGGYSLTQATIAIGSAGLAGQGWGRGPEVQYGFLPEAHTDLIFSAFVHEWGAIGAAILFILLFIFLARILSYAIHAHNNFSRFIASGTVFIFLLHIVVNIGMNVGVLPIVGLPLPFISYGGSGLVSSFMLIGLLQSIRIRTPKWESASFEKNDES